MSMSHAAHRSILTDAADEEADELRAEIFRLKLERETVARSARAWQEEAFRIAAELDDATDEAERKSLERDEVKDECARLLARIHRMEAQ